MVLHRLIPGVIVAAGLVTPIIPGHAQEDSTSQRLVHGHCAVAAQDWRYSFDQCRLPRAGDGVDPAGRLLVIGHAAVMEIVRRLAYQAWLATRLYAGPWTKIEPFMKLETGFLPPTEAPCGAIFHGHLVPAVQ